MTNPKEIPTEYLLQLYRHTKATVNLLEDTLMQRGAIKCPKCGVHHGVNDRHVFGMVHSLSAEVSG